MGRRGLAGGATPRHPDGLEAAAERVASGPPSVAAGDGLGAAISAVASILLAWAGHNHLAPSRPVLPPAFLPEVACRARNR